MTVQTDPLRECHWEMFIHNQDGCLCVTRSLLWLAVSQKPMAPRVTLVSAPLIKSLRNRQWTDLLLIIIIILKHCGELVRLHWNSTSHWWVGRWDDACSSSNKLKSFSGSLDPYLRVLPCSAEGRPTEDHSCSTVGSHVVCVIFAPRYPADSVRVSLGLPLTPWSQKPRFPTHAVLVVIGIVITFFIFCAASLAMSSHNNNWNMKGKIIRG